MNRPQKEDWNQLTGREGKINVDSHNHACDRWEKWISENRREMIDMQTGLRHSVVVLKRGDDEV